MFFNPLATGNGPIQLQRHLNVLLMNYYELFYLKSPHECIISDKTQNLNYFSKIL